MPGYVPGSKCGWCDTDDIIHQVLIDLQTIWGWQHVPNKPQDMEKVLYFTYFVQQGKKTLTSKNKPRISNAHISTEGKPRTSTEFLLYGPNYN